jgi:D-glycero-alpha-D-manno-heptose-7-phosphate kinase
MLMTSRTPLRISLFGGGTDYPGWYERERGAVIGFTIDKHIYISALRLSSFVDYRYRISYSKLEATHRIEEIQHPVVRAVLLREHFDAPIDCSIQADLPANTGLGTSSAFTVGFLNLVAAMKGVPRTKMELARLAIEVEQQDLQERVGVQDQLHATFGGLNHFEFEGDQVRVLTPHVRGETLDLLADWMLLVYTGTKRHASATLGEQLENTAAQRVDAELREMLALVDEAHRLFEGCHGDELPRELSGLLAEGWRLKRRLSSQVTNSDIDALYEACLGAGALSGKLCGAGGGGFLLMIVPPERRAAFIETVGADRCIPFRIEHQGSTILRGG